MYGLLVPYKQSFLKFLSPVWIPKCLANNENFILFFFHIGWDKEILAKWQDESSFIMQLTFFKEIISDIRYYYGMIWDNSIEIHALPYVK